MGVSKEWLLDEKRAVEERIQVLEQNYEEERAEGYLATANFLRKYIVWIDEALDRITQLNEDETL